MPAESAARCSSAAVKERILLCVGCSALPVECGMGEEHLAPAPVEEIDQALVGLGAHQGDDVVGARAVHGLVADERQRVLGAPPVEVGPALAPVPPLPLAQD